MIVVGVLYKTNPSFSMQSFFLSKGKLSSGQLKVTEKVEPLWKIDDF
jgi:hypothetical protein